MNHFTFLILIFSLLTTACSSPEVEQNQTEVSSQAAPEVAESSEDVIEILAFGDSITEGFGVDPEMAYPAQLERKLVADGYSVKVTNGGIGGETSSGALTRLDWMAQTEPDIVIINIGGNDGLRAVDLDLTAANIDKIVQGFDESGAIVVVAGMQMAQNLGEQYTTEFAEIYPAVSEKYSAVFFPFFLEGVAADPDLNQADLIHPNAEGYTVIVENMYPFVIEAIELFEAENS
ncbi:MAG: arylesterase [Chloroflexota bacterium]